MLNPKDKVTPRIKKAPKPTNLSEMVKPQHRMEPEEIIERLKRTLDVDKRVRKNIKNVLKKISDKILYWKRKFGDVDI